MVVEGYVGFLSREKYSPHNPSVEGLSCRKSVNTIVLSLLIHNLLVSLLFHTSLGLLSIQQIF